MTTEIDNTAEAFALMDQMQTKELLRYTELSVRLEAAFKELAETLAAIEEEGFVDGGMVHKTAADNLFSAPAFAAILMQHLDWDNRPRQDLKKFLVELADELGPDHVEHFRASGAFMKRVDSF